MGRVCLLELASTHIDGLRELEEGDADQFTVYPEAQPGSEGTRRLRDEIIPSPS
jgi:hypothetical protein